MSTTTEPCPEYDEKLYRTTSRKRYKDPHPRAGEPVRHSRWVSASGVPRYSKPQEKWFGSNIAEPQGWHRGARVYV